MLRTVIVIEKNGTRHRRKVEDPDVLGAILDTSGDTLRVFVHTRFAVMESMFVFEEADTVKVEI